MVEMTAPVNAFWQAFLDQAADPASAEARFCEAYQIGDTEAAADPAPPSAPRATGPSPEAMPSRPERVQRRSAFAVSPSCAVIPTPYGAVTKEVRAEYGYASGALSSSTNAHLHVPRQQTKLLVPVLLPL